jgi:Xaa-Pro aminopeptidase
MVIPETAGIRLGKVLISLQASYAISLMFTYFQYTVASINDIKAVKNKTEVEGMRRVYLCDGASFVGWLTWLENNLSQGCDITEYRAA